MAIRLATLSLWLWCALAFAVNNADEEAKAVMDTLDALIFQDTHLALSTISKLEQQVSNKPINGKTQLRLSLMKCNALVESGSFRAALNVAKAGDSFAKKLKLEQTRPYFLNCMAVAHMNLDNLKVALPLFDSAANLAKRVQQTDALIAALFERGQIETSAENFSSAIEDLQLALELYDEVNHTNTSWSRPPKALIYAAMANLLYITGDLQQAITYAERSLHQKETKGMLSHSLHRNIAKMYFDHGDHELGEAALNTSLSLMSQVQLPPRVLSYSYAIISSIELSRGHYSVAEELAEKALSTFKSLENRAAVMRASRLLAQTKFALQKPEQAINLMRFAIHEAEELKQYYDLNIFYQILANYYAEQGRYHLAYEFRKQQGEAAIQSNQDLSNERLLQFKARLNQHHLAQAENQQSVLQQTTQKSIQLTWAYRLTFTLSLVIIILFIFSLVQRNRGLALARATASASPITREQKLESMFDNALKSRRPLTLVLLDITNIRQVDLPQRLDELKQSLRSQDLLLRYSSSQVIIALPYTTEKGAEFVSQQLSNTISNWQSDTQISIGIGSLQPFDTLPSLIKRANINRLNKAKHQDVKHGR